MEGQCSPCMIKDVAGGAETRTGCSISEKGVASQTAGGVPGENGRGALHLYERLRSDHVRSQWQPCDCVNAVCPALWQGTDSNKDRMPTGDWELPLRHGIPICPKERKVAAGRRTVIIDPETHRHLILYLCSIVSLSVVLALGRDSRSERSPGQATGGPDAFSAASMPAGWPMRFRAG